MATLTADQLADLQADLGISDDESVFTDVELNRLYARADDDYDTAKVYALRQLVTQAARLTAYTQGQTTEQRQQVFQQLRAILQDEEKRIGISGGKITAGYLNLNYLASDEDND